MSLFVIFMKSPNSERTDFCRAIGPKEMDSSLNLQPKSLFWGKKISKLFFVEPWDQKKWIPHSIYDQNHSVCGKNFFHKHVFQNK